MFYTEEAYCMNICYLITLTSEMYCLGDVCRLTAIFAVSHKLSTLTASFIYQCNQAMMLAMRLQDSISNLVWFQLSMQPFYEVSYGLVTSINCKDGHCFPAASLG